MRSFFTCLSLAWLIIQLTGIAWAQEQPIPVKVGFRIMDLNEINTENETFSFNGELYLSWPESQRPKGWTPAFHFVNAQDMHYFYESLQAADSQGYVHQKKVFRAVLNTEFTFQSFPFDSSTLKVYLESANRHDNIRMLVDTEALAIDDLAFEPAWDLHTLSAQVIETADVRGLNMVERLMVELPMSRYAHYHLWSYFIPLLLISATSWTVFWFHPPNIQVTVISMLGLIAYNMAFARQLPQLSYLNLANAFFLLCLVCIFIANIGVSLVLALDKPESLTRSHKIRRSFAIFLPLFQITAIGALFSLWV